MHASSIATILLASCDSAHVIPGLLKSTMTGPRFVARTADKLVMVRREDTTGNLEVRGTMVRGTGPRIDDIVEIEFSW
jgi:hypothetical protein